MLGFHIFPTEDEQLFLFHGKKIVHHLHSLAIKEASMSVIDEKHEIIKFYLKSANWPHRGKT